MMAFLKKNLISLNCLESDHFLKQFLSNQRCRKCQKPHHTWLHVDKEATSQDLKKASSSLEKTPSNVASHTSQSGDHHCQVITEHLAQCLHLPQQHVPMQISGIGGTAAPILSCGVVNFKVSPSHHEGKDIVIEAVVLPKVTTEILSTSVAFDTKWKHLLKLQLADPDFSTPGNVYLILGADVFSHAVRYGQWYGPPGSSSTFKTSLGWVLAGATSTDQMEQQVTTYCASILTGDDLPRKFWEMEDCKFQKPALSIDEKSVVQHFKNTHTSDE